MKPSLLILCTLVTSILLQAQSRQLRSPDGRLLIEFTANGKFIYKVKYKDLPLMEASSIDLQLKEGLLSAKAVIRRSSTKSINELITSPVPEKRKLIRDQYNELVIEFKQPFSIVFRAYNDGFAYRFLTRFKDSITITNEIAGFNVAGNPTLYY